MNKLPFAEDVNYWQTSQTSPDAWMDKIKKIIIQLGGSVIADAYGNQNGQAAFMMAFKIQGDEFKVIWPVLPTRGNNERAARVQAITLLYHDIKAKCLSASVLGTRAAFFSYLLLPDGRSTTEATVPELTQGVPAMFSTAPQLVTGEIVDEGEQ